MSKKIEKIYDEKNSEIKVIVPIESNVWKTEQKKAFDKLAKKLKVKGYRAGKVPIEIAKQYISDPAVWEEAISKLLNISVSEAAKQIDPKKDIVLDSPTYSVEKISKEELEINFIYPIFPSVEIKKFDGYKIKFNKPTEKDIKESVKKQIDDLLSRGTLLLPKEGKDAKVEMGDTITFDFKGYIDDKPFDGGEAEGFDLKIGSGNFIPGFEDQLVGKSLGWKGSIKVRFPNEYYKDDLKNKEAKFDITIHEIKYNDKQKMTDDFVKTLNIKDVKTEKDLNEYLERLAKEELLEKQKIAFMNEFNEKVLKDNDVPAPRAIVLKELQALLKKFEENLRNQGITKKEYYDITNYDDEKVRNELNDEAIRSVKKSMLYSLLAKQLNIIPTEEDYNRQFQRIGRLYNIDPQVAKQMMKKEQIEPALINELLIDHLIMKLNPDVKLEKEPITFTEKPKKEKEPAKKEKESKTE